MSLYQLHHIETPRLIIRPVQLGDEFGLHEAVERSIPALRRWMPWARDTSFNASQEFIHRGYEHWQAQTSKDFPLTVIHKESQKIISVSGYNEHTDLMKPCFEIGYWIDSTFEGQGLAKELVNALARYALEGLKAIRTQICTQVENEKSTAVATRCGFVYEAMIRNICIDCESRFASDGQLFSCCDAAMLPPLEVTWRQDLSIVVKEKYVDESDESRHLPHNAEKLAPIQTKRFFLRAPRIQDTDKLYVALMASLDEVSSVFSWVNKALTRRQLQPHVDESAHASQNALGSENVFFLVWDRDQKNVLGEIWLKLVDWAVPNIQIGFWFDARHVSNGHAFEAVSAIIRYAFSRRNAKCIQLYIPEDKSRHLSLARRLGFKHEGKLKRYFKNYLTGEIISADLFSITDYAQLTRWA